ncbi:metal-dependent transcriptional regulator [Desulfosporosinus fructosivorans]|uniref:Metal-dependent transcriptional regulator n=1 Tax=Desulfosporosinus fructosivorans TaxID=2018669 RepID=A0A4Z0R0U4_9FIRM|nr:metal-dependent transcriptional regulator [Desulfosporosinus fructosivorans]TGE36370.1 metal-dependent transcriptional regulator [Desulfosporosinus fructosivorans]
MTNTIELTSALEDYLEVILELGDTETGIRVTDVAAKLNIAKSTVTITLNKLKMLGMVTQESYGPIVLTRAGKAYAVEVRKRHRILREFLVEVLGVDYQTAEKDACLMEHVVSPITMNKITEFIAENRGSEFDSKNTYPQTRSLTTQRWK